MAATPPPSLEPEIGPDGLARDSPVLAYTEKVIAEEQLQLKKYIQENYSKIRDVEKELENLTLEVKLTAGPKKAAWEAAEQIVKEEEDAKQRLCDDLNRLVQESAASHYSRLEELKKRLECLNPVRASVDVCHATTNPVHQQPSSQYPANATAPASNAHEPASTGQQQRRPAEAERKRRPSNSGGRGRGGVMALPKERGSSGSGWTGAGFET